MPIVQLHLFGDKYCPRCFQWKALDQYRPRKSSRDGLFWYCEECCRKRRKEYYRKNKERINKRNIENYYRNRDYYRELQRNYHLKNRERHLELSRQYRQSNIDQSRERDRKYYLKNKERLNEHNRAYHKQNKVQISEKARQWRRQNRAKCNAVFQRRRARLKAATGQHTAAEWIALREWFGNVCLCCGTHDDVTTDHVIPLIKGGTNNIDNLQPLCRSCNSAKHDKTADYRDPDKLAAFLASLL